MHRFSSLMVSLAFCLLVGCDSPIQVGDEQSSSSMASDLVARLEAAKAIQNDQLRDKALATLAKDAAKLGDGTAARDAIDAIRSDSQHDTAAAEAAVLLAKAANSADGSIVAKLIRQDSLRDQTLAKIAAGN